MAVDIPSMFAQVIQDHLELKRRNAALEHEMPIERYLTADPFENHPLFKTEEQARMEDTMDAYVLGLIGMSKVYLALGANYASKYYALCALWATRNTGDERCFAKQGLCYEAAYRADLLQGKEPDELQLEIVVRNAAFLQSRIPPNVEGLGLAVGRFQRGAERATGIFSHPAAKDFIAENFGRKGGGHHPENLIGIRSRLLGQKSKIS